MTAPPVPGYGSHPPATGSIHNLLWIALMSTAVASVSGGPVYRYRIIPDATAVNEGQSISFTIQSSSAGGTGSVNYIITGISKDDLVSGDLTGTLQMTTVGAYAQAKLTLQIRQDSQTEGLEKLKLSVDSAVTEVLIYDTSREPTYTLTSSATRINEGEAAVFLVTTTNVPDGTVLPYTIKGVESADIVGGLSGSTVVVSGGQAVIAIPTVVDMTAESTTTVIGKDAAGKDIVSTVRGIETMTVSVAGISASVQIKDQTTKPSFSISALSSSVQEGGEARFLVKTSGLMPDSGIRYEISGSTGPSDYVNPWGGQWGIAKVTGLYYSGQMLISIPIVADHMTEGVEQLKISIGDQSATINIVDTSRSPTFSIKSTQMAYKEGTSAIFNIATTNLEPGTWLNYRITGEVNAADVKLAMEGQVLADALGNAKLVVPLVYDRTPEGSESLTVEIVGTTAMATVYVSDVA